MYNAIIVDDETLAIAALQEELLAFEHIIKVVGQATTINKAVELIDTVKPTIVFLDIQLKEGSGFDILDKVLFNDFVCVFVTAYDKYAINAFKVNAIDYLLKPVHATDMRNCIEKICKQLSLKNSVAATTAKQKIIIPSSDGFTVVCIDEIIYCESDNNYTTIYTEDNSKLYISKSLKQLEIQLINFGFDRVHQSYLVNLSKVKKFSNKDGGFLILKNHIEIPVSRRNKIGLMAKFLQLINN